MARQTCLWGVLFDLDGTLLDTAPDLAHACNTAVVEAGLEPQALEFLKPMVSGGASAMLRLALNANRSEADLERLEERMLSIYLDNIAVHTRFFAGMDEVLDELESRAISWGIVTNKLSCFTDPLLQSLGLDTRSGCVISGDTLPEMKPHPMPMWEACRRIGSVPAECVYIGDARRDIEAGKNAGMATLAALYGYIPENDPAHGWGADGLLRQPTDLLAWLDGTLA
ncbi:MAG: HAD-IA family hydrolase [Proteobacteria bacterium]|nr:HAD-IA family hydrolase [Pseudomonadota bacterium]